MNTQGENTAGQRQVSFISPSSSSKSAVSSHVHWFVRVPDSAKNNRLSQNVVKPLNFYGRWLRFVLLKPIQLSLPVSGLIQFL